MAGDDGRKLRTQPAPELPTFLPGRDFSDLEARHGQREWRCEVSSHRIAVEVGTLKRSPWRVHHVTSERGSGIEALAATDPVVVSIPIRSGVKAVCQSG